MTVANVQGELESKAKEFADIIKIGRTHTQVWGRMHVAATTCETSATCSQAGKRAARGILMVCVLRCAYAVGMARAWGKPQHATTSSTWASLQTGNTAICAVVDRIGLGKGRVLMGFWGCERDTLAVLCVCAPLFAGRHPAYAGPGVQRLRHPGETSGCGSLLCGTVGRIRLLQVTRKYLCHRCPVGAASTCWSLAMGWNA